MNLITSIRRRLRDVSGRSRAIGMFFATSLAARGIGISCQLVQVPIAIKALGPEAFGLWMTLTGVASMIVFADFGLGQGAQNKIAAALGRDRLDEAQRFTESALVFLVAAGGLLFLAAVVVLRVLDPAALFNLQDPAVRIQARGAMLAAAVVFCLNFPAGFAQRLALATQRGWYFNVAQAAGSVLGLAGTIVAVVMHWPLARFIAAAQGPAVLANAVLLVLQLHELGWVRWPQWSGLGARMRELMGIGAFFGVQQLQLMLSLALPQVIISTTLGAAAVTPYNLAQRLYNLFAVVQNAFMLPLWPAYSDAGARGEFAWIRRTLRRSLRATAWCTLLPMLLGAIALRSIVGAWVGGTHDLPSVELVWLLFAWNALNFLQQPFGFMLAGLSVVKRQTLYAMISVVASVALMMGLVRSFGTAGVVLGMIVGFMPFFLLGNIAETIRVLRLLPAHDLEPGESWSKASIASAA